MYFVLYFILPYWVIKIVFLISLLIVLRVKLAKVKFYLFPPMDLVSNNVSILFIVMFGGFHLLFLTHVISTLSHSLMISVALLGFIFYEPKPMSFQSLSVSLPFLRLNFLVASKSCDLILGKDTCPMSFRTFSNIKVSFPSVLALRRRSKTVLLKGRTVIF